MADLEAVLADVSYLMAMEKSKSTPAARASKKIVLPDPSVRSVMHKYLEKNNEVSFEKIFNQKLGYLLFKDYCETLHGEPVPQLYFYEEIRKYERLETEKEREVKAKEIYDTYIMGEELGRTDRYPADAVEHVWKHLKKNEVPTSLFQPYVRTIFEILESVYEKFLNSEKYTRFCQWKNLELNIQLTMNDFSFHRIIGRGGFGEVYGCRKADTGKMYAMKCLDKKRIKMKQGEMLALNERIMLSLVSTGDDCPFIVNMTYAFQTPEKLYFVLDLMNGGDLHYHLSQHGRFTEGEMRFYAAEVVLGLEHMHNRHVVYRDLKPANILLDEYGHVRISDLGLACDFSKKKPQASVGTHGYMAPEVLCKGQSYDSSADWFSLGCMLYKLLRGHSPFRHGKTRDKNEIDRLTVNQPVEMPDTFSIELRSMLTGLLQREVHKRLGCRGRGADELKAHPFFRGIDWRVVYLQRLNPPLIPARGEVNAADAFDIGSFDDEDTKHIKLTEADQELYRNFPVVVSERWQHEIAETIFDYINHEADKAEMKRKSKNKLGYQEEEEHSDCILHGYVKRLGGTFTATWLTRYVRLYPNRLELWSDSGKQPELIFMDQIEEVCNDFVHIKGEQCIVIKLYNHSKYVLTNTDEIGLKEWHVSLKAAHRESLDMMTTMAEKATKIYGTEIPVKHMGKRRQQLQQIEAANAMLATATNLASGIASNWEQKIIQKELQASSSSASAVKQQQVVSTDAVGGEQQREQQQRQQQLPPPAPQAHRHSHRSPHVHRSHSHRHHHHYHGPARQSSAAPDPGPTRHAHAHHSRHGSSSSASRQLLVGSRSSVGAKHANRSQADAHTFGQHKQASLGATEMASNECQPSVEQQPEAPGVGQQVALVEQEKVAVELSASSVERMVVQGDERAANGDGAKDKKQKSISDQSASEPSDGERSSTSGTRSDSCSSSAPADEPLSCETELVKMKITNVQDKITSSEAELQANEQQQAPKKTPEAERVTLAVSLENVNEQQEVLVDPSKRITSDNKQREQDLVAQYEKLNVSARHSSSSIDDNILQSTDSNK